MTGLLDYLLRYLRLAPIGCLYLPHDAIEADWRMSTGKRSGYVAVLCRALDQELAAGGDNWMADSAARSWEYQWLCDWERAEAQPVSRIRTGRPLRRRSRTIDLTSAIESGEVTVERATGPRDGHTLGLGDRD